MDKPFAITYKYRRFGPCGYGDGKKEEIVITADGKIQAKRYDHNGANNRWRIIERASGIVSVDDVEQLYIKLNDMFNTRKNVDFMIDDAEEVIVIEEPGVQISFDANLNDGENNGGDIVRTFFEKIMLNWEEIKHK